MIDRRRPPAPHLAVSLAALRDSTGQAKSFEMTPIRKKTEEKEKGKEVAVVASSPSPSSSSSSAAAPIEQRRLEAQRHRHTEVWTKVPHGGRHIPVSREGRAGVWR